VTRAANMQALTRDIKRQWPGVVVYGVGDEAHQTRASDHNEDDTAGSKAAQSDPDGRPEHRAIDVMLGPAFTRADADALVARVLADPKARARLYGVIWHGSQWWRSNGWAEQARISDPHNDHIHFSGHAADDENTASWPAVAEEDDMGTLTGEQARWLEKAATLADQMLNPELGMKVGKTPTPLHQVLRHIAWPIINGPAGSGAYLAAWMAKVGDEVGVDADELAAITAAAREGAAAAADELIAAVVAKLPDDLAGLSREQLVAAVADGVRDAFADGLAQGQASE